MAKENVGDKFGRLTILKKYVVRDKKHRNVWKMECICDCGKIMVAHGNSLYTGNTRSCGCLKIELRKANIGGSDFPLKVKHLYGSVNSVFERI